MNQPVAWGPPHAERADAARNRQLLLATAREIVAGQGAGKLTMDGLAERAGLGKGTVFRRFGTRGGSSRRCWTTTSGPSRSRFCPVPRRWALALSRWTG